MSREIREVIMGAIAVAFLLSVIFAVHFRDKIVDFSAGENIIVTAKFNKVDGLVEGSEVRLGGIKVGHILKMALDEQFRAILTLTLKKSLLLPADSSASIHTDGLFGYKFVVLEPGAETVYLKSGGELSFTQDAVVVGDLLELIISEGRVSRDQEATQP